MENSQRWRRVKSYSHPIHPMNSTPRRVHDRQSRYGLGHVIRETAAVTDRKFGGASRDRTDDLIVANDALSQLSYSPLPVGRNLINSSSASRFEQNWRTGKTPLRVFFYESGTERFVLLIARLRSESA